MRELKEISTEVTIINLLRELRNALATWNNTRVRRVYRMIVNRLNTLDGRKPQVVGLYLYLKNLMQSNQLGLKQFRVAPLKPIMVRRFKQPTTREVTKEELYEKLEETLAPPKPKREPVPSIEPLTSEEESALKKLATRPRVSATTAKDFEKLKEVLERDILNTIASKKKELIINNKIKMARLFLEFGNKKRAKELVQEALAIDPSNKTAKMLESLLGDAT